MLIALYCVLIAVGSFLGGWLLSRLQVTHTRMQLLMSGVGGLMLGVALLHLLPHAIHEVSVDWAMGSALFGLVAMFCLIRVFQIHHHGPEPPVELVEHDHGGEAIAEDGTGVLHDGCVASEHRPYDPHDHDHVHHHGEIGGGVHRMGWLGLFGGLALHTLMDGIALAASVVAARLDEPGIGLLGVGTFLAILLHKPLEAMSIVSMMKAANWSGPQVFWTNAVFALMCPLGAVLFWFGLQNVGSQQLVLGVALGFSSGVFLCVALADILPEVQFHSHDRGWLTLFLFLGLVAAIVIGLFEPEHAHDPHAEHAVDAHDHGDSSDHGDHEH